MSRIMNNLGNIEYQHFLNIFIEILNKYGIMKQKYLRANQGRFMIQNLKAIMKRSRLRNKFLLIGQIFPEKNTKSREIFVLAS